MAFGRCAGEGRPLQRRSARRWPTPTPTSTRSWTRWASCRTEIDAANGWDLDSQLSQAMDALQCPDPDTPGERAVPAASAAAWRCAACCWRPPDLLLLDEPTNHLDAESVLWLEQFLQQLPGRRASPSPTTATSSTTWPNGSARSTAGSLYPYKGNYSTYLETKAARHGRPGTRATPSSPSALKHELEWVRSLPEGPSGQEQGPSGALRRRWWPRHAASKKLDFSEIQIPAGPRLGSKVLEAQPPAQGLRRAACSSTTCPSRCRATASWA